MKRNHKNHLDLSHDFSLESLRDQNSFRVPDGYFDELPLLIKERVEENSYIRRSRRIHPGVFAAAASVVVLLGLTLVMRTSIFNAPSEELQFSTIPESHIVNHLDSAIINGELEEPILVDAVIKAGATEPTSKVNTTKQAQNESTGMLSTVSDEEIIEYLIQNNTATNSTTDLIQ